jgi:DNA polymerase elongation subunit (family B)
MRVKLTPGTQAQPGRRKLASGPQVSPTPTDPGHRPVKPEAERGDGFTEGPASLVAKELSVGVGSAVPSFVNAFWVDDQVVFVLPGGKFKRERAKFSLFVKDAELDLLKARKLREMRAVVGMRREGDWHRVDCRDYEYRRVVLTGLETHCEKHGELATYEGDLNPVKRALLDLESYQVARPRRCYLDIETDPRPGFSKKEEMRILCVGIFDHDTGKRVARLMLPEDTDVAERQLLDELFRVLDDYDQIVAWNGDRFDFPVIRARVKARGVKAPLKRWLWLDFMLLFQRMNMSASESGEEKQSYALNAICKAVLGEDEGKLEFDAGQTYVEWEAGGERRERMGDYCDHDVLLMWKLEQKKGYIDLLGTLCEVTGAFPDSRGINPQTQVEMYLLRLSRSRSYKPRTKKSAWEPRAKDEEQIAEKVAAVEKFRGAWVMQPKSKGFARDVHVCDFSGLYPNIIRSWNMSAETRTKPPPDPNDARPAYLSRVEWNPEEHRPRGVASAPGTGEWFLQEPLGLLAEAVTEMMKLRKYWNELKATLTPGTPEFHHAESMASAYKIAINSFYGVVGSPTSSFFVREVAESVAQAGVWLIQQTIAFAESRGLKCIYGDTDSAFIVGCTEQAFRQFASDCNAILYPKLLEQRGCARNHISLAYEKQFAWVVFVASKKYCNPPEAPVLMADMTFKSLGEIKVGDLVMGWIEGNGKKKRHMVPARVGAVQTHEADIVELKMSSGSVIRCTPDHNWLRARRIESRRSGHQYSYAWCTAKTGRRLVRVLEQPPELPPELQLEAAWLGGLYDGEGSTNGSQLQISQSPGRNPEVCSRIERVLTLLGFEYWVRSQKTKTGRPCNVYAINGGKQARLNFMTWCRPAKAKKIAATMMRSFFGCEPDEILSVESSGFGEVIGLTTETGNYVVWGHASKNCGKYAHYKGTRASDDSEPEVRGLEYKRGDTARLARELQKQVIDRMMASEDKLGVAPYVELVEAMKQRIILGDLKLEDFVLSKRLSQSLKSYKVKIKKDGGKAAGPPHVEVARLLKDRGRDVGEGAKIEYVCIDGSTSPKSYIPAEDYQPGVVDRHEVWETHVYPATMRLLQAAFPADPTWERYEVTRPPKPRAPSKAKQKENATLSLFGDGK